MMLLKVICYQNFWTSFLLNFLWLAFTNIVYGAMMCILELMYLRGKGLSKKFNMRSFEGQRIYTNLKNLWWSFGISIKVDY